MNVMADGKVFVLQRQLMEVRGEGSGKPEASRAKCQLGRQLDRQREGVGVLLNQCQTVKTSAIRELCEVERRGRGRRQRLFGKYQTRRTEYVYD